MLEQIVVTMFVLIMVLHNVFKDVLNTIIIVDVMIHVSLLLLLIMICSSIANKQLKLISVMRFLEKGETKNV